MVLSDFHNGYTSVSLYSQYSLTSHSVRVAEKMLCWTKNYVVQTKIHCPAKLCESQKICCGNKKNYVKPKKRLILTKYVYCCTEKKYMLTKKFMLYINICCID